MNRTQKKELRQQQSTRQLMGIDQLTEHGLKTAFGELVFYLLKPNNLSVMSKEGIRGRVLALTNLLSSTEELHLMALDSRESFQQNKDYYQQRLASEELPALRELLRQDAERLDQIQTTTASSREFLLIHKLSSKTQADANQPAMLEKSIRDYGFHVRLAARQDVMRLLAVYYQQDVTTDHFESYDGERYGYIPPSKSVQKQSKQKKKGKKPAPKTAAPQPKGFLDMIAPAAVRFNTDHYILGGTYRCVLALRSYPTSTEELALLRHLGEKSGVTLHIYARKVTPAEEKVIIDNASNKNRMEQSNTNNMQQSVAAEVNLQDVVTLIAAKHRNPEPLFHCAVFIELSARDTDSLRSLRETVTAELTRFKLSSDRVLLRQREGFLSVNPAGHNAFGALFERVLPASSVANLFPFNYSGKTDPCGFYIGKDLYGSNIIVDLERRADDKTTGSVLILGNSGQGKSFLQKLLICNTLESGKNVLCFDTEHELVDLCEKLGGCFVDMMSGQYIINLLEPKLWNAGGEEDEDTDTPLAFRQQSKLSQHISFLKDIFRSYKDFSDRHIDTIELMLERLYAKWGLNDRTDFSALSPKDYPTVSDLYDVMEEVSFDRALEQQRRLPNDEWQE